MTRHEAEEIAEAYSGSEAKSVKRVNSSEYVVTLVDGCTVRVYETDEGIHAEFN